MEMLANADIFEQYQTHKYVNTRIFIVYLSAQLVLPFASASTLDPPLSKNYARSHGCPSYSNLAQMIYFLLNLTREMAKSDMCPGIKISLENGFLPFLCICIWHLRDIGALFFLIRSESSNFYESGVFHVRDSKGPRIYADFPQTYGRFQMFVMVLRRMIVMVLGRMVLMVLKGMVVIVLERMAVMVLERMVEMVLGRTIVLILRRMLVMKSDV